MDKQPQKTPLQCAERASRSGKPPLLGEMDARGIYLYCKLCHRPHFFSRGALLAAFDELERLEKAVGQGDNPTKVRDIHNLSA